MYSFLLNCTNSVVLIYIYIFLKSCTTTEKLYNQRKKLYIFCTLSLALNFLNNGVCTKMYSFFQSCKNSVVLICIFLKSCTTIKKLYNQRKKLYIFGTLSMALNFIHNGVVPKCTVLSKAVELLWSSYIYIYFAKAVQQLKSCTRTKGKSCTSLVHCPWLLILLTMVLVPKCTVFSKAVQILWSCIFVKSCRIVKKLYNQRKKLYTFCTLSLALNFIHNGVCTKMYSFFQSCTNSVVLIYIFLKSCTTKEKSCTYIFGTLSLALNFIHNGVCTKMYSFFQSCTNSVVLIYIFLKSCTTIEKLYNQRKSCTSVVHCPWLLISFTMMFVPKCTVFSKTVQILWSSYIYIFFFLKSCTTTEKLYNQRKKLYIFCTLSLALNFIHNGVCTKMYSFFQSCTNSVVLVFIFLKSCTTIKILYNQTQKLYIFGTLSLALNFIHNGV